MRRALLALVLAAPSALAAQTLRPDSAFLAELRWRSIGPANMGGRVSDVEGNPQNPREVYAAFATGGLWKTTNNGTTWEVLTDGIGVHTVSDVAIAPSDTSIVWIGTGEEDTRNSISPGTGVFKSEDGGRNWHFMGLRQTQAIGRILIHPTDPNIVYVAALGHPWGRNAERGVYKTTDGGQSWRLVKAVSDRAGAVDMTMDPSNPDHLLASFWERQRGPYYLQSGGPGSGLWETTDGGEHWSRVTNGLPQTTWGRSATAFAPSQPATVYALVEADSNPNPASVRAARQRGFQPDTTKKQHLQSGLFRSTDGGRSWERMNWENDRPFYYTQIRVDPRNADRLYWAATRLRFSADGGRTLRQVGQGIHTDFHALWIDPTDSDHYWAGQDGGLAQTWDRGRTWDGIYQMPLGQFYAVSVDMQNPFWVCGGLQDNGSWCGPSESPRGRIFNQDWTNISGGDGFHTAQDPTNPDVVYSESQGGAIGRIDLRSWERHGIRPGESGVARRLADSVIIARGDTTRPPTPEQQRVLDSLQARIAADTSLFGGDRYNWSTPFFISPHNPNTLYLGGQRVFKTVDRGEHWNPISDDLSTHDSTKIRMGLELTGGVTRDVTAAEVYGTVVTLAESPVRPGIVYAGTDDGNVWLTRNDGAAWENLTGRFPGLPPRRWTSRVRASAFDSATVYVTFDGHRDDDFHPYVFVSNDFGRTFRSLTATLPDSEYVFVITEDPRRRDLLFLGTEHTAYVSLDRGASWAPLNANLPPVPVHDLVVHPRDAALVAGTHGRSVWILDIGPLEQVTDSILREPAHLFAPEAALLYNSHGGGGGVGATGSKVFSVQTPGPVARFAVRITAGDTAQPRQVARGGPGRGRPGAGAPPAGGEADTAEAEAGGGEAGPGGGSPLNALVSAIVGGGGGGGRFGRGGGGARTPADTIAIVITNVAGDTVRTLYTSGRNTELRWITWDLRGERRPMGPAAQRDSVRNAERRAFVTDSVRTALRASGGIRSLTGPPGEPGTYVPMIGDNYGIVRSQGGGFFGGGFGERVEPGLYLVTMRFNGKEYRQTLRVEPPVQTSTLSGGWQ